MDKQLEAINEIIILCDEMLNYINRFGIIRENNNFYCSYKKKIDAFMITNDLRKRDYAPFTVLSALFFHNTQYSVSLSEANMIRETVIKIKQDLFSDKYERIFISHREKDKEHIKVFIELLYAIGITRATTNTESIIFCSSHPDCYLKNGDKNLDTIKGKFKSHFNTLFLLWYSDNYFESQACLNEAGAIWATEKQYQEILTPNFDNDKIGGMMDKQPVWFYANDKFRLNTFKTQIEEKFCLSSISQNAWELARDEFIERISLNC